MLLTDDAAERVLVLLLLLLELLLLLMFTSPPPGGMLLYLLKFSLNVSLVAVLVRPNPRGFSSRGVSRWISSNAENDGRARGESGGEVSGVGSGVGSVDAGDTVALGLCRLVFKMPRVEGGTHELIERVLVGVMDDIVSVI